MHGSGGVFRIQVIKRLFRKCKYGFFFDVSSSYVRRRGRVQPDFDKCESCLWCRQHSLVSVVSYWESFCSSYMSTSTLARAGPSITLLMFSLARASASRSPRPHTDWSSRMAAKYGRRGGLKEGGGVRRRQGRTCFHGNRLIHRVS